MLDSTPHFLIYCETISQFNRGTWRFSLEKLGSDQKISATDAEDQLFGDRLALLCVVRALEAMPEPGRVTLLSSSKYVCRGFRFGLPAWQKNNWNWERFGKRVPVKNCDLWQRIDQAMKFHTIDCRPWRFSQEAETTSQVISDPTKKQTSEKTGPKKPALLERLKTKMEHYSASLRGFKQYVGLAEMGST